MSDRRERLNDSTVALQVAMQGWQANLWTALPCKITQVNKVVGQNTVHVQPTIMGKYLAPGAQAYTNIALPQLLDCPIQFPGGGNFVLTFPVQVGDEGLVVFSSRCIDSWFGSGADNNVQAELRMHDLSDGFFIPGFRSRPNVVPSTNRTSVELRSLDHSVYISIDGSNNVVTNTNANVTVNAIAATINAPTTINGNVNINGALHVTGTISSDSNIFAPLVQGTTDVEFGTRSMNSHVHGGVSTGTHNTGAPV